MSLDLDMGNVRQSAGEQRLDLDYVLMWVALLLVTGGELPRQCTDADAQAE